MTDIEKAIEELNPYQRSIYVKNKYLELAEEALKKNSNFPDIEIKDIMEVTEPFFKTDKYDSLRSEKLIFETTVNPLRFCSYNKAIKHNFLKFQAASTKRFIDQDFDFICSFMALEGKGKSVASLYWALQLKELGMQFNIEEDMFFRGDVTPEGFQRVFEVLSQREKGIVIFDEGKAFFDNRQSMYGDRIAVVQEITAQRSKNNAMAINVGADNEIDIYFRERRLRSIYVIPDRRIGVALHNRGIVGMGRDRFALGFFEYLNYQQPSISHIGVIRNLLKLPTQYGYGTIPHIPEEVYKQYKELKDNRNSILDTKNNEKWRKRVERQKAKEEKARLKELETELKKTSIRRKGKIVGQQNEFQDLLSSI